MGGLGALAVVLVTMAWLFTTASGLAFMIERSTQGAPFDISLESIELRPSQTRVETDRWRIVLHRLMITPHDPDRATIAVRRIELDTPSLRDILQIGEVDLGHVDIEGCLLYTSPSPRDLSTSRMPSSA